ncbi:MAG: DeoR/GlpR family DNA-binding transcription regulator [Planctomycetota bacterium]|nr:DeoR/GlpR family DNA-binding transcription regulator [Planctomycetota bacterium]
MTSLARARQSEIARHIDAGGQAIVSELAKRFSVSEMTIRRDLRALEDQGLAVRVHGGALAAEKSRFSNRLSSNLRLKAKAIGKLSGFIPDRGCVYLDGSTTMLNLVKHFKGRAGLNVVTNNVETFNRLASLPGPTPLLLGGGLDLRTDNLIGPLAIRSVGSLAFDVAFFSAWGLDAATGLNEVTVEDAEVKEHVARRARAVRVAVDHTKIGVTAGGVWNHDSGKAVLATDLAPGNPSLAPFAGMFKRII